MENTIEKVQKQLYEQKENFLYECFKRHGYSRSRVMRLAKEGKIRVAVDGELEMYFVKNRHVFSISKTMVCSEEYHKITYVFREEKL